MSYQGVITAVLMLATGSTAMAETLSRDLEPDTGDEALDLHIHDPSRIMQLGEFETIAVTGKEQAEDYDCGLELWTRPAGAVGPWHMSECLLRDKPDWVAERVPTNGGAFWAPDFVDADRIIYSVASIFEDGGPSCLGLAVRGPDDVWRDIGDPLSCTVPRDADAVEISVIDPAYLETSDGGAFVVTGGGVLHVTKVDPNADDLGMASDYPGPGWTALARGPAVDMDEHDWIEAPYLHEHDGAFYLFVNWGACCQGAESTYEIRVGRAESPFGPFRDREGNEMLDGYGTLVLESDGSMRGPGHASIRSSLQGDSLSFHYYDADRGGLPWIGEVGLSWHDGWPKVISFPTK